MRNFILVFVLLFSINSFSQSQISQDNFEGNSTITTWFGDSCGMDNSFVNPFQNGINTSAKVLKYTDAGGQYANIRFDAGFNYNLNTSSVFTLKIYVPSSGITGNQNNQISLKLQNGNGASPWATQCEIIKPIVLNQWQTITFNFASDTFINLNPNSQNPLLRSDFNRVVLQVNGENNTSQVTAFIDDFYYSGAATLFNTLVWSDEFDTNGGINTSKWFPQTQLPNGNSWYNGELQHYTNRQVNSSVSNGIMSIVAKRETFTDQGRTKQFTSARLNSKFAFKYGRVEVRAKLPTGVGTWPAIWMLGKNINEPGGYWTSTFGSTGWPACGEIDIMEHWGTNQNFVQSAMHTPSSSGNTVNLGGQTIPTASTQFHVYTLEWTSSRMIFSVDNVVHYVYNPTVKNASTWPFDAEQYILLNVAIQSSITTAFVQSAMEVDYVRVYQQTALENNNVDKSTNLVLSPNPASDEITLKSNGNLLGATISIHSLLGQELETFTLNTEETTLNISNYQSGIYILKVNSQEGIQSYKFIKK